MKAACVYIAPLDRILEVKEEVKNIIFEKGNFIVAAGPLQKSYWAQNIWIDAKIEKIESIKKAALFLKAKQRNWWHYPLEQVRRTKLIQEALPSIKGGKLNFPAIIPQSPLGSFALKSETEMIYSAQCTQVLPNGEFHFEEAPVETPSEAYLKLWEALTRIGKWPAGGDYCVDIGSAPGSWTQALLRLSANVFSVDKASLEIMEGSRLTFVKKDAFKIKPEEVEHPTWILSDIICYPEKLYELAQDWLKVHPKANFVFTIKFQGKWDKHVVEKFERIPNSKVLHLFNNKHELCWIRIPN